LKLKQIILAVLSQSKQKKLKSHFLAKLCKNACNSTFIAGAFLVVCVQCTTIVVTATYVTVLTRQM